MENPAESASKRPWSSRLQSSFGGNRTSPQQPQGVGDGSRGRSPSLRRVGEIFRKFIAPTTTSSAAGTATQRPHISLSQELNKGGAQPETPATPTHKREYRPRSRSHSVEQFLRRLLPSPAAAKARRPDLYQSQAAAAISSNAGAAGPHGGLDTQRESGRQEEAPRGRAERRVHPSNLPPHDIGSKNSRYNAKTAASSATAAERSPPCTRQPGQKAASAWGGPCSPPSECKYSDDATPRSAKQQDPSGTFNSSSSPYFSESGGMFKRQASQCDGEASSPEAAQHFGFGNDDGERGRKSSSSRKRSSSRRPDTSRAQHSKSAPSSPPSAADESTSNTSWEAGANGNAPHASERTAEEETNSGPSSGSSPRSPEADDVLMVETRTTQITTITTMITAQPEAGKSTIFRRSAECTVDELQQHWRFGNNNSGSSSSSSSSASCQGPETSNDPVDEVDLNEENAFRQQQQHQQQPGGDAPAEVSQSASTAESCDGTPLATPEWDAEDVSVQHQQQQEAAAQHQQQQEWHREQHEGTQDNEFEVPIDFGYTCFQQPQVTEDFHAIPDSGRLNWQQRQEQLQLPQNQQQQPLQLYEQQPLQFLTQDEQECGYAFVPSPASPWMQPVIASPQQQAFHPLPQQQQQGGIISPCYIRETVRQQADQRCELSELSEEYVQEKPGAPQQQQQLHHEQQCLEPQPAEFSAEALQREVLLQQQLLQYQQDLLHNQRQQHLWQQQQQQLKAPRVRPFSYNAAAVMPGVFAVPPDPLLVTIRPRASRPPAAESAVPTASSDAAAVVAFPVDRVDEIPSASVCSVRAASAESQCEQGPQVVREQKQQQRKPQEQQPVLVPCVAGRRGASSSRPPKRVSWAGAEVLVEGRGRSATAAPHTSLSLPLKGEQEAADACLSPATASTTGGTPPGSRGLSPCDPLPSLYVPICHTRHL
ncbi:hypothetical protein Emag_001589 [Eimeria magna]